MKIRVVRKHIGLSDSHAIERTIDRDKANGETIPAAIVRWMDEGEGQGELLENFFCKMLDVYAWNYKKQQWTLIMDLKLTL